jgi:hypothetical protein
MNLKGEQNYIKYNYKKAPKKQGEKRVAVLAASRPITLPPRNHYSKL